MIYSSSQQTNMGEFPSGQRGQTVNLLSMTSLVRIQLPPPRNNAVRDCGFSIQFDRVELVCHRIAGADGIPTESGMASTAARSDDLRRMDNIPRNARDARIPYAWLAERFSAARCAVRNCTPYGRRDKTHPCSPRGIVSHPKNGTCSSTIVKRHRQMMKECLEPPWC